MITKTETQASAADIIKISVAVILLLGTIVGYYQYPEISKLIRVVGLLAAAAVAVFIVLQTEQGRTLSAFVKDAQIEVRKVVWPTKQETMQTTGIVIIVVVIVAMFLWFLFWLLGGIVRAVM